MNRVAETVWVATSSLDPTLLPLWAMINATFNFPNSSQLGPSSHKQKIEICVWIAGESLEKQMLLHM